MPVSSKPPAAEVIPPSVFAFLRTLARHNERAWFNANKERYQREMRDPLLAFIAGFAEKLERITGRLVADPSPVGGSLFRIYRDTRFAKDKSPYKTHAGIYFGRAEGRDSPAPGFYLHVEPGKVFMAAGIWRPEPDVLKQVRDAIVAQPARWKRVGRGLDDGEKLARPPRGYPAEHPLVEDLKRKQFIVSHEFGERDASKPGFSERYAAACRAAVPLLEFLTEAVGRDW
ncbi:MAG TPA: DUF2461 domain-containing protein [Myxococcota bacterium]|nr:DUF2461 domain-containing protein [Myxococcota bacterium]